MHDVFISYKSEDSHLARSVVHILENHGVSCWFAERDIGPGSNYAAEIPAAIAGCKVFLLLLTENAQRSPWIPKELDNAITRKKSVIPLVIGSFEINREFSFSLTDIQFFHVTNNLDKTVALLLPKIRADISSGVHTDVPKKKFTFSLWQKLRYLLNELLSWVMAIALLLFILHLLGIDVLSYFPEEIRQAVLSFKETTLIPFLEKLPDAMKKLSAALTRP